MTTIPSTNNLAHHIIEQPALARFHACLVDAVAEHVVIVAHDDTPPLIAVLHHCITDGALVAFDVEFDAGRIQFWNNGVIPLETVVGDGQEGPAERVEVDNGRRLAVNPCLVRSQALRIVRRQSIAVFIPGR